MGFRQPRARQGARSAAWKIAAEAIAEGKHRLVILDELTYLCTWGWIDTAEVVDALRNRPDDVNVIVTGRDCPPEIIEIADTVTEMRKVKHAYDRASRPRRASSTEVGNVTC
jgi:cob(I)alamin adenosyltransferase